MTVYARDVLPSNLVHYLKDRVSAKSVSMRHSRLYLKALELVKMGDSNIATYDAAMDVLVDGIAKVAPVSLIKDGLGLAEKEAAKTAIAYIEDITETGETVDGAFNMGFVDRSCPCTCFRKTKRKSRKCAVRGLHQEIKILFYLQRKWS